MKQACFKIPIYDWMVKIGIVQYQDDYNVFKNFLKSIDASEEAMTKTLDDLVKGLKDGGDLWYDFNKRLGAITMFPCSSKTKFYEVLNHEKRHLIDRILQWANIQDHEAAAYLDGYVSSQIYDKIKDVL